MITGRSTTTFSTQDHYTHLCCRSRAIEKSKFLMEIWFCELSHAHTYNCLSVCVHEKFLTHVKHPSTAHMLPKWLAAATTVEIVQLVSLMRVR